MKWSSIQFEVFEAKDFEDAYSKWLEKNGEPPRRVPISEMDFELIDFVPNDPGTPIGMGFAITVDGRYLYDIDLLSDDEDDEMFYLPNGECLGAAFWDGLVIEDHTKLFNFDVSQFKSFKRWTDNSSDY